MANTQKEVLNALLQSLLDKGLLTQTVYDKAKHTVNSTTDFPEFFEYRVCCQKEGEVNGRAQNQG